MNATQRQEVDRLVKELNILNDRLDNIEGQCSDAIDNMPESLVTDEMTDAFEAVQGALSYLQDAISELENIPT